MKTLDSNLERSNTVLRKLFDEWKKILIFLKPQIILPLLFAVLSLILSVQNPDKTYALILNIIAAVLMAVVGGYFYDSIKDIYGNTILNKKGVSAVRNLSLVRLKVKNISDRTKSSKNIEEIINLLSLLEKDVANSTQEWTDIVPEISNVEEVYRLLEEKETSIEIAQKTNDELTKELESVKIKSGDTKKLEEALIENEIQIKELTQQLAMLRVDVAATSATLARPDIKYIDFGNVKSVTIPRSSLIDSVLKQNLNK